MSAEREPHPAWWRRWAYLPVVVALLFAASGIGATPRPDHASPPGLAPSALQAVIVPPPQAIGQRPNLHLDDREGQDRAAPHLTLLAWLSEPAGTGTVTWWHPRRAGHRVRAQAGRDAHRVRGPPGRRAVDASS